MRATKRSISAAAACQQPEATASAVLSATSSDIARAARPHPRGGVQQGLLHQPRPRGDQAAQMPAIRRQRIQRQRSAHAGQHARRAVRGMRGDHGEEAIHAQALRFGIGVAHAAGFGRRAQPVRYRVQSTGRRHCGDLSLARPHPPPRRPPPHGRGKLAPGLVPAASAMSSSSSPRPCASQSPPRHSAHFSRVLPRSSSSFMRDAP